MKKIITLSLVFVLLLSSCSIEKDNIFYKQLDCKKITKVNIENQLIESKNSNLTIKEIFYSPIKDSCLYVAVNKDTENTWTGSMEGTLYLFDYNKNLNLSLDVPINSVEFYKKIKELKGE